MNSDSPDILSPLKNLPQDDWDRLRLGLWRRFGGQLRNIPEAPSPDDLLTFMISPGKIGVQVRNQAIPGSTPSAGKTAP
ncbi:hypothetical protein QUF80_16945 [Desulfococcaceae bacterium HSG8]|nr:hypothetical protein [Desulfococcaceae bacterium HSG8]